MQTKKTNKLQSDASIPWIGGRHSHRKKGRSCVYYYWPFAASVGGVERIHAEVAKARADDRSVDARACVRAPARFFFVPCVHEEDSRIKTAFILIYTPPSYMEMESLVAGPYVSHNQRPSDVSYAPSLT
jgi:hypothetical protein